MKKGSISLVLLISLVVLLSGAAVTTLAVNEKFRAKEAYAKIENRYIAESGIEMAIDLFLQYVGSQDYVLAYQNVGGAYSVSDSYAPYLIHEIQESENTDNMDIAFVAREANDYLSSIGFLDFSRDGGIEVSMRTMNDTQRFKLSRLCVDPSFVISTGSESGKVRSRINPVYITVKSKYKGGEVLCSVQISNIYIVRKPFSVLSAGELASVAAWIDVSQVKTEYQSYQNYRIRDGGL